LFANLPSPHPGALTCPFTPKVLRARERASTPFPSIVFTFGLAIKSIKELEGVLMFVTEKKMKNVDSKKMSKLKFFKKSNE